MVSQHEGRRLRGWTPRDAHAGDVDRIVAGSIELARQHGYRIRPTELREWALAVIADGPARRVARYVVVPDERGCPVGFALLVASPNDFRPPAQWWLETLFVFPDHRGAGVGAALLQRCEHLVRAEGGDCLLLRWSVLNGDALPFYARAQYLPTGDLVLGKHLA